MEGTAVSDNRRKAEFEARLESLLNEFSMENGSNTPDFVLAAFLVRALDAFNAGVTMRERWYGRDEPKAVAGATPLKSLRGMASLPPGKTSEQVVEASREDWSQPAPSDAVIAGARFDFAGYLTMLPETMPVGACEPATPMVDALQAWAKKRGLNLEDADVSGWRQRLER